MKTSSLPPLHRIRLEWASHFHQPMGCHPRPALIPPYYERVELMTGGRGWIEHEGEWREVRPGDLIWNKPGDYTIGRSDFKNPYRCFAVTLVSSKRRGLGLPRFTFWEDLDQVRVMTREVCEAFHRETMPRSVLRDYVLGRFLFIVGQSRRDPVEEETPSSLIRAMERWELDLSRRSGLAGLAKECGWSVSHLHAVFRNHFGVTPHQWLLNRRVSRGRKLLVDGLKSVKEIATLTGFADTASFSHAFKRETGSTPREYRDRYLRLKAT